MEPRQALESKFEAALKRAKEWDYDVPSAEAVRVAEELFRCVDAAGIDPGVLQITVAADGAIAIHAANEHYSVDVEIEPQSGSVGLLVTDEMAKRIVSTSDHTSGSEVARQLGRAA
jgi:hypothetical protein